MNSRIRAAFVYFSMLGLALASLQAQEQSAASNTESSPEARLVSAPTPSASKRQAAVPDDYKIGPGDLLSIHISKEPDLSRSFLVRPDGKLSLPMIGELAVSNYTVSDLKTRLTTEYQKFINTPEITVILQEARSHRFNVVGQVQRPGSFVITQPTTVLDAIALVGGFRDFAKTKKIYVIRAEADGTTKRLPFDYNKVLKGQNWEENIQLQSGDTIVVP